MGILKQAKFRSSRMVTAYLIVYDVVMLAASFFLALWVRFDARISAIPENYMQQFLHFLPIYLPVCILIF